ncbi:MAG TPA: hypothetical protein VMX97_04260 [Hyphomicrobiaceae bacterium]|nr:hypothetical protein [Hyphomicrobiaceae bacterium]
MFDNGQKAIQRFPASDKAYTIATLVTDPVQYSEMCSSYREHGFEPGDCEYLYIDNTAGSTARMDAFTGLNHALNAANGEFVILCHQDVRLIEHRAALDERLAALEAMDPAWAVAGNAGGTAPGRLAIRITDPHGENQRRGTFPARALSVDENFIVIKRRARVGFSRNLNGFHFYGADICLSADVMGYTAYVIDFHLRHLSPGRKDTTFTAMESAFRNKWSTALRPRWIQTTCSLVSLAGGAAGRHLGRLAERPVAAIMRRLPAARDEQNRSNY